MYDVANPLVNGEVYLSNFLEPKTKVLFDVGVEDYVYYLTNPGIMYHLFEPVPDSFGSLKEKIKGMTNVIANNYALGSEKGDKNFYFHGASFIRRPGAREENISVKVDTIDNYISLNNINYVDFIKIDTEGWELEIIRGAVNSLDKISHIQYEYGGTWKDGGYRLQQMVDILIPKGYELFVIVPNGLVRVTDYQDHFQYCNYFATRKAEEIQAIIR